MILDEYVFATTVETSNVAAARILQAVNGLRHIRGNIQYALRMISLIDQMTVGQNICAAKETGASGRNARCSISARAGPCHGCSSTYWDSASHRCTEPTVKSTYSFRLV